MSGRARINTSPSSVATLCVLVGCGLPIDLVLDTERAADTSADDSSGTSAARDSTTANLTCDATWPGPFAYYRFDECTHLVRERMRSGLDAVLVSGRCDSSDSLSDTLANDWNAGGALTCPSGETGCARIAGSLPLASNSVTISLWVKAQDWRLCEFGDSSMCTLFGFGESSVGYELVSERGALSLRGSASGSAAGPSVVEAGSWHHIVATMDIAGSRVYLDGVPGPVGFPVSSQEAAIDWLGTPGTGAMEAEGTPDDLRIDEVLLWNFAMTPGEVAALFTRYNECGSPIDL